MLNKKLLQSIFCVIAFLVICLPANAQVFLEEGKVELNVSPGENIAGTLTLHNTTDKNVDLRVYWEDFIYKPPFDGSKDFLPKGTTDHSSGDWVNVSSQTLTFGPFAKRNISYTINVPDTINQGHYGVLFFENIGNQIDAKTGLNVVTRVGCLFFIEPKNKVKKVDLTNFRFEQNQLIAQFSNEGNVVLIPDGTFYVINDGGEVFDRGQIDKIYLPANQIAEYSLKFNRELSEGMYTLVMTVDLLDDNVYVKEIDFKKSYPSAFNIIEIRD